MDKQTSNEQVAIGKVLSVLKVALYIGLSAAIDYLINYVSGNAESFGNMMWIINLVLVSLRQMFKTAG